MNNNFEYYRKREEKENIDEGLLDRIPDSFFEKIVNLLSKMTSDELLEKITSSILDNKKLTGKILDAIKKKIG